jgi:hypothetical protein
VPIRSLAPLGGVVLLVGLVDSFVLTFLPLFLSRDLRASPVLVSLFLFGMPVAAVVAATVVGRLSSQGFDLRAADAALRIEPKAPTGPRCADGCSSWRRERVAWGSCSSPCRVTTGLRWPWR